MYHCVTGFSVGCIILLPSALDVCPNNGRILGKFCILFLCQVWEHQHSMLVNTMCCWWQVFGESLVCVGHPIKSYSNGGQFRPEWRMGGDAGKPSPPFFLCFLLPSACYSWGGQETQTLLHFGIGSLAILTIKLNTSKPVTRSIPW